MNKKEKIANKEQFCFLSFKWNWLLISFSPTKRKFYYYSSLVSHLSLFDFTISRDAVLFPFVALISLVLPISQLWDSAKFQSQCVLYKVRMCLHSYKHEDMIKTCFRTGKNQSAASCLHYLTDFVVTVDSHICRSSISQYWCWTELCICIQHAVFCLCKGSMGMTIFIRSSVGIFIAQNSLGLIAIILSRRLDEGG